jgi:hypothetical protein
MPSTRALGIDANSDPTLLAAMTYREDNVYPYMLSKGIMLEKRQGPSAVKGSVAPKSETPEITFITGEGHGNDDTFMGQHNATIFQAGHLAVLQAQGKIVHLLACDTARTLGPDFVANGCRAFFGYDDLFTYAPEDQDIFFECDSEIDRALADGLTAAEAFQHVQDCVAQRVADLNALGAVNEAAMLQDSFNGLRCPSSPGSGNFGDPTAKLS